MLSVSIIYLTGRKNPKFEWFCDALANQLNKYEKEIDLEIVIVDRFSYDNLKRKQSLLKNLNSGSFLKDKIIITPPKPTVWQGPLRLTQSDYFAAANARNTGAIVANKEYLIFVDDISVPLEDWLKNALHAVQHKYVVCGSYRKVLKLKVENGEIKSFEDYKSGWDCRWTMGSDSGIVPCLGDSMFGCSFGLPLSSYIEVNGQDEIWDSSGGEDFDLGIRLLRHGCKLYYNRNMCTYESEELHHTGKPLKRIIKPPGGGPDDSSQILLRKLRNEPRITPIGNQFTIIEQRDYYRQTGKFLFNGKPNVDWYDNQPLSEM